MASAAILDACTHSLNARTKADHSPVTAADHAGEPSSTLPACFPVHASCRKRPWAAHRRPASPQLRAGGPLDSTRELLAGQDEFTVNVAIVEVDVPVSASSLPRRGRAVARDRGRRRRRLRLSPPRPQVPRTLPFTRTAPRGTRRDGQPLASRPQSETFLAAAVADRRACGSAFKFCHIAEEAPTSIRAFRPPASGMAAGPGGGGRRRSDHARGVPLPTDEGRELSCPGFRSLGRRCQGPRGLKTAGPSGRFSQPDVPLCQGKTPAGTGPKTSLAPLRSWCCR
jgi:hypothetical protein